MYKIVKMYILRNLIEIRLDEKEMILTFINLKADFYSVNIKKPGGYRIMQQMNKRNNKHLQYSKSKSKNSQYKGRKNSK